jgi:hypothetical protein
MEEEQSAGGPGVYFGCCRAPNSPAKKTERVFVRRGVQRVDLSYDDPVVTRGVLGDDLALEGGEGVREQRDAAASELQSRPANRSAPAGVARIAHCSGCRPSTFTPKRPARRMRDHVSGLRDGENETKGRLE